MQNKSHLFETQVTFLYYIKPRWGLAGSGLCLKIIE